MNQINAYLNHTLSPEARRAFEAQMQADPSLAEAVEREKTRVQLRVRAFLDQELSKTEAQAFVEDYQEQPYLQEVFEQEERMEKAVDVLNDFLLHFDTKHKVTSMFLDLKPELLEQYQPDEEHEASHLHRSLLGEELPDDRTLGKRSVVRSLFQSRTTMYVLAACLALLLAVALVYRTAQRHQPDLLAATFMERTDSPNTGITLGWEGYEAGIAQFEEGKFQEAIALFQNVTAEEENYAQTRFLMAYALLKENRQEEAVEIYETILREGQSQAHPFYPYVERSRWYLALAYLQQENEQAATELLKQISADEGAFMQQSATELLKNLQSFWRSLPGGA